MSKTVIFGGTTEGRRLCEEAKMPVVYCVATDDGAAQVQGLADVSVRVGRLDSLGMNALLQAEKPSLVLDATHPYAREASRNIALACEMAGLPLERIERERADREGCTYFESMDELVCWLLTQQGNIFAAIGATHAKEFLRLRHRLWLRILPSGLEACIGLGFPPERLILGQGPFSEAENLTMFKAANANILVTRESGAVGGFPEKVSAAKSLGMAVAVLKRPVRI